MKQQPYNDHEVRKGTRRKLIPGYHISRLQQYLSKREKISYSYEYPKTKTITNTFGSTLNARPQDPRPRLYNPSDISIEDPIYERSCQIRFWSGTQCLMCNHVDHDPKTKKDYRDLVSNSIEESEELKDLTQMRKNFRKCNDQEVEADMTLSSSYQNDFNSDGKTHLST